MKLKELHANETVVFVAEAGDVVVDEPFRRCPRPPGPRTRKAGLGFRVPFCLDPVRL